ncbi:MAG: response regulator transcription factor [Verrucomicrobiaceae bacterium]|nr:MAG: response regulator transcription factor [Verrucomicrobiaceae bacterium]
MNDQLPVSPRKQRILIVDDHAMIREGLVQLIDRESDLTVCGEAGDAFKALELIESTHPDLVLADLTLPGKSGLELIKDIRVMYPGVAVLVLSMHDETIYAERVLRAGARGYIMKQEGGQRLMQAIRRVIDGQSYVSERVSAKIVDLFSGKQSEVSPIERLTDREFEVFQLIGAGKTTKTIAEELHLSAKTVEVHRARIKEKLQLAAGAELISFAARWMETNE